MNEFLALHAAINSILQNYQNYEWTTQGFGFIRTYLDEKKRYRLNVWNDDLRVSEVSDIHDHPWDFRSWILAGCIINTQYFPSTSSKDMMYRFNSIQTGEGGGQISDEGFIKLKKGRLETYAVGKSYFQKAEQIHQTDYWRGTVSLNERIPINNRKNLAHVFWYHDREWIDAMPRPAHKIEVATTIKHALKLW